MKRHCFASYPLFFLIGLILSPLAVVHAAPSPADSVHFCLPFDYEQWRRDHPRPAGKPLAGLKHGEPRTVRMIYFLPNDRPYRAAATDTIKMRIRQVQDFFAEQMKANRQGNTTFRFETDAQGEPLVLRVDGQHPAEYYNIGGTVGKVLDEIVPVFDMEENVYYIAIDSGSLCFFSGEKAVGGVGSRWKKNGGFAMVSIHSPFGTVAHELGHAFDLRHDFRDDTYVMSYGYIPDWLYENHRLSACNTTFLAVHPYFNANIPIEEGSRPTLEKRTSSPIQTSGATSIPVRIKVRDPDELHQAILFARTPAPHFAEGFLEVKACRGLEGRRNPVVEFDYDGTVPSMPESDFNTFETQKLRIGVVDALGGTAVSKFFELVNNEFRKPISTLSTDHLNILSPVVFSSDGRLLALEFYEDDKVRLRDVTTDRVIATLPRWGPLGDWALSPDDRLLALEGPNRTIVLWDISSREQHVATAPAHQPYEGYPRVTSVFSLAFSPDGKLLASGGINDLLVKLWDVASGKHVATFSNNFTTSSGSITSLAFSPDGKLLAALASWYGGVTVMLWDVANRKSVAEIDAHEGHSWARNQVAFSPDSKLLATGGVRWPLRSEEDSEVKLWDVASREPVAILSGSAPVSFSPDGRLLASASPMKIRWVSVVEGGTQQATTYGGQAVKLWDVATSKPVVTLPIRIDQSYIEEMSFHPDGRLLVEAYGTVQQWDISEWSEAIPHTLTKVSGDGQEGRASVQLAKPLVVSVLNQDGFPVSGVRVTFSVTAGGGLLSPTSDADPCAVGSSASSIASYTDANGQASVRLTLGSQVEHSVNATIEGLEPVAFTATTSGQASPHRLTKVCGDSQEGLVDEQLAEPFVVSVSAENGAAIAGVVVSFAVTAGGGTLSATTATTDANGRAATRLTLGSDPGTNMVSATVAGLASVTFTATGQEDPLASLFDLFGSGKLVALPDRTQLLQNAPNPFNSQTVLSYFLLEPSLTRLEVFSLTGQRVAILHQGPQQAGYHRLHWDGRDAAGHPVASGAYLYRLVTDDAVLTRKLILLR